MSLICDSFLNELKEKGEFVQYLQPIHDTRDSFYKKAKIYSYNNYIYLISYETIVAYIEDCKNEGVFATILGYYSQTTSRHINEFLKQNGFKSLKKKDFENTELILLKKGDNLVCN